MLVNGHQVKIYKKPLSRQEFIETMEKLVLVVEQGSTSIPSHGKMQNGTFDPKKGYNKYSKLY